MALAVAGAEVHAMQQLIRQGQWQDEALLSQHWCLVGKTLGEADDVIIVASLEVPPHGVHSVGVARQWCGPLGTGDNCQLGVFTAYASRHGYTLVDRWLDLAEDRVAADGPARRAWYLRRRRRNGSISSPWRCPRRVAPVPDQGGQPRAPSGCVRVPTWGGSAYGPAGPRRGDHLSTGCGEQPGIEGLS